MAGRDSSSPTVSISGTMVYLTDQTSRLRDINILSNMAQYHLQHEHQFWSRDYEQFMKELIMKKSRRIKHISLPVQNEQIIRASDRLSPNPIPKTSKSIQRVLQSAICKCTLFGKQSRDVAIRQTSGGSWEAKGDLCCNCAREPSRRLKPFMSLFRRNVAEETSHFRYSPDHIKRVFEEKVLHLVPRNLSSFSFQNYTNKVPPIAAGSCVIRIA